jgi:DNA-binding HxlR family transcriptional regulator
MIIVVRGRMGSAGPTGRAGRDAAGAENDAENDAENGESVENAAADRSYRDGIYDALALLAGEWVVAVLASLATRALKYGELRQRINDAEARSGWRTHRHPVSQKVLSATLKRMRRDGLIKRTERSDSSFQPVWYELTPLGRSLLRSLRPLAKWAHDSQAAVEAARERYADDELPEE